MTKFAITFAGQGSQSVAMMAGFADLPIVQRTFEEASEILKQDVWKLAAGGPSELQNQTVNTQPLMLCIRRGYALQRMREQSLVDPAKLEKWQRQRKASAAVY